ncbi:MAG TPA: DegQ family serine endoprotease [Anaeromyxobacter sp.]|nr:DegQ family serine endoprotease [Anaeromyxobacter sp.]
MRFRLMKSTALAAAIVAATAGGYLYRGRAQAAPTAAAATPAPPVAAVTLPDFSAIVQRYGPAVVNVSTTGTEKTAANEWPFGKPDPNDPFFYFFRHFGQPEQRGQLLTHGLGSGFIVRSDGVILTNAHVVAGASEVTVKLTDKREFRAKVTGIDKTSDIAVLRIEAKDLPVVRIGDPARIRVGEWVLAIGSPFGFENSATAGIVSARARPLPEGYVPFIQTDVAVNPGNSGGPLFDAAGEVIGVNSQIYSQSGGYMGLSFAIPIDVAMRVEQELLAHGKVVRGRLGVAIQDVNQSLSESFGLPKPSGALVSSVEQGSPAAKAGLEAGDIILALNGTEISGPSDLPARVAELQPGSSARLEVWRNHQKREIEVRVGEAGGGAQASAEEPGGGRGRLGLAVRSLTPEERQQAGVSGGVVVEGVQGPAARAGIQPGDVVLSLNGTPVNGVEQLRELVKRSGAHVALLVERGESRIFVPVDLG